MTFVLILIAIIIVVVAFKFNVLLGIAATALIAGYGIYRIIPSYYTMMGNKAFQIGDEKTARIWYKKAYDTGRTKITFKINYAYLLLRLGEADEAEKVLDPIIRVKSLPMAKKYPAKQQRCMVYYKQGRLDEAIEDAQSMMDEGFRTTQLYGMLGYFKLLRNDPVDEVTAFCEEAYEYNSDDKDIKDNLSLCYYKGGKYEEAEKISDALVQSAPTFLEAYYHGAQIALKLGKRDKAKDYLEKIKDCRRSALTTVSEEEIEQLKREVENENTAG